MSYFYWVSLQWEWNHCCSSNNADSFWQSTEWGNRCALSVTFQTLWTRKVAKLCNCQDLIHKFNNVSQEWLIPWLISERGMNLLEKMKFLCFDWLAYKYECLKVSTCWCWNWSSSHIVCCWLACILLLFHIHGLSLLFYIHIKYAILLDLPPLHKHKIPCYTSKSVWSN